MTKKKLAKVGQHVLYRTGGVEHAAVVTSVQDETVSLTVFWDGDSPSPISNVSPAEAEGDGFVAE